MKERNGLSDWLDSMLCYLIVVGSLLGIYILVDLVEWIFSFGTRPFLNNLVSALITISLLPITMVAGFWLGMAFWFVVGTAFHEMVLIIIGHLGYAVEKWPVKDSDPLYVRRPILTVFGGVVFSVICVGVLTIFIIYSDEGDVLTDADFLFGLYNRTPADSTTTIDDNGDAFTTIFLYGLYNYTKIIFFVCAGYFYFLTFSEYARGRLWTKGWPIGIRTFLFSIGSGCLVFWLILMLNNWIDRVAL